jgi:hypothetical protein
MHETIIIAYYRGYVTKNSVSLRGGVAAKGRDRSSISAYLTMSLLHGHSDVIEGVASSPDGKQIASASLDNMVRLWDSATGMVRHTLPGHSDGTVGVAFSPDENRLRPHRGVKRSGFGTQPLGRRFLFLRVIRAYSAPWLSRRMGNRSYPDHLMKLLESGTRLQKTLWRMIRRILSVSRSCLNSSIPFILLQVPRFIFFSPCSYHGYKL